MSLSQLLCLGSADWKEYVIAGAATVLNVNLDPKYSQKGAFKMASFGEAHPSVFGDANVCIKQVFITKPSTALVVAPLPDASDNSSAPPAERTSIKQKITYIPLDGDRQFPLLISELKARIWAQALFRLVYNYIDSVNKTNKVRDFIEVPKMRFVDAALAIEVVEQGSSKNPPRIFLLEEMISEATEGVFRKYMNNLPSNYFHFDNEEDYTRADFLRFSQHLQYWKTKGSAYVSDYQGKFDVSIRTIFHHLIHSIGGSTLLTDPQVMTNPYVIIYLGSIRTLIKFLGNWEESLWKVMYQRHSRASRIITIAVVPTSSVLFLIFLTFIL